jgi:uncharacterized protein DUF6916
MKCLKTFPVSLASGPGEAQTRGQYFYVTERRLQTDMIRLAPMSEWQTAEEFRPHLNTPFRVQVNAPQPIELMLINVESRPSEANEEQGMERFSVFFMGSPEFQLPQNTYRLAHPEMGEFEVFLVAIAKDPEGYRYEAVYNYYKP